MLGRLAVTLALLIVLVASPLDAQNTTCSPVNGMPNTGNDGVQCVTFGELWVGHISGFAPGQLVSIFITGDVGLVSGADWTARVSPDGILRVEVDTRNFHGAELQPGDYRFFAKDFGGSKGSVQRLLRVLPTAGSRAPAATPSLAIPATAGATQPQLIPTTTPANAAPTTTLTLQPTGTSTLTPPPALQPTGTSTLTPLPALQPTGITTQTPTQTLPPASPTASPTSTSGPTTTLTPTDAAQRGNCDSAYPDVCIPSPPPELSCEEIPYTDFRVLPPDPHGFDRNENGVGCESEPSD